MAHLCETYHPCMCGAVDMWIYGYCWWMVFASITNSVSAIAKKGSALSLAHNDMAIIKFNIHYIMEYFL